ncbi:MAG: class I tRNA ligase family protein [bacterium]|nr:class I tRNA ligase family protein [bacterium]
MERDLYMKSAAAKREEEILAFWKEHDVFKKTLEKDSPNGEFVFYEGPPGANGKPHMGHFETRVFKDAIPRYKTMRGYHVRRRAGWDTHGLPVEIEVEKQLGLTSKKEIEEYGVAAFNEKCKESVWKYVDEWVRFSDRMGYWLDHDNAYVTYTPTYIESVWSILSHVHERGLLYKDYKVLPWCPRCGTALSSHELAQGYKDVKELSVTAKFKITTGQKIGEWEANDTTYVLAWTTTPWTLPGNVALAVGKDIEYVATEHEGATYIFAKACGEKLLPEGRVVVEVKGSSLAGLTYEPLYSFMDTVVLGEEKKKLDEKAYKIYTADFVNTQDGTGVVHTAVMYGHDDFVFGTSIGLPKHHVVHLDGTFVDEAGFLAGRFVKDEAVAVDIIKDMAHRGLLFSKEKYEHAYPHCWRCKTPVIYYARDSWYIKMSALRDELVDENSKINWVPEHIKEGRFGEWLREVKDWALSRERYWGTPLPIWTSADGKELVVVDSIATLKKHACRGNNSYIVMRHGPAVSNVEGRISSLPENPGGLTPEGRDLVRLRARELKDKKIDLIIVSPLVRTQETAKIIQEELGLADEYVVVLAGLKEIQVGALEGKTWSDYYRHFGDGYLAAHKGKLEGGENLRQVAVRAVNTFKKIEVAYENKNILIISHGGVLRLLLTGLEGATDEEAVQLFLEGKYSFDEGQYMDYSYSPLPLNDRAELDLHRPYIDEIQLISKKGTTLSRVKEVADVWFDSGAMPFAQDHYPFENKERIDGVGYPADFISEAVDQTRGWFYTLHAIGVLMGRGKAYKNVISLGHVMDREGKKMSKSVGNVVDPTEMMDVYGADALRFWMCSINQPGDSKNFDVRTVDEVVKKVFNLLENSIQFYDLHKKEDHVTSVLDEPAVSHVLDRWIISRVHAVARDMATQLDVYDVLLPTRALRDYISDLSQWYIRRSRDRFKEDSDALYTARYVFATLSRCMAPFVPFVAEDVYLRMRGVDDPISVHLLSWPEGGVDEQVLLDMHTTRSIVSRLFEKRSQAGIKIRQPLAQATITVALAKEYCDLIAEEVHVHEVVVGDEISLDTVVTQELALEGAARELARGVQQLRKDSGLDASDEITLVIGESEYVARLIDVHGEDIMRRVRAREILLRAQVEGETVSFGDHVLVIALG